MAPDERPGPRERLLRAAADVTYRQGLGVGVDAILREADAARRSLYQHFAGKDELLAAALARTSDEDLAGYRAALAAGGDDPRQRVLALFSALDRLVAAPAFRGCRYLAADLALAEPEHPARRAAREHKRRLRDLVRAELVAMGHAHPDRGADQLLLLIDATLVTGAVRPDPAPSTLTRPLVAQILA